MPKELIEKIVSVTPSTNYKGERGYIYTVVAGQTKMTCWVPEDKGKEYFKKNELVNTFFNDNKHSSNFKKGK